MSKQRAYSIWALALAVLSAPLFLADAVSASTAQVGVYVEPTTTLAPPPTTTPPRPVAVPTPTPVTVPPPPTVAPAVTPSVTVPTERVEPAVLPPSDVGDGVGISDMPSLPAPVIPSLVDKGIVGSVKVIADKTRQAVTDVFNGKPIADALGEVLPAPAAAVVVPAVKTASTFAFPISLVGAVFAFLAIQQRIDSADPKLAAAPLAHDDDLVDFE